MVGAKGFEPSTSWSRTRRASQAALRPDCVSYPLSCACSNFFKRRIFGFPSIPSNNDDFGRKFETQTGLLCHFFAKRHVRFDLVVEVGHALSGMTHPELQETWRSRREVPQVRVAKATERMDAALWLAELGQDWVQLAPQDARLVKWPAAP